MTNIFPTDFTEKVTPANDDKILLADSADSSKIKYGKFSNFKWATGSTWPAGADGTDWADGNGIASITTNKVAKTTTVTITEDDATVTTFDVEDWADGAGSGDISGSGTANEIAYFTAEKTIDNLPVATYPSLTELSYVKGVTSAIQTQINGKQATGSYEVTTNKETSALDTSTTKYPCNNVVKSAVDAKLALAGWTMTGAVGLWENSFKLDPAISADGKRSGITVAGTGWETLAFGDLCYFKAADSKRYKAKADSTTTSWPVKLGLCVLAGASTTTEILIMGNINAATAFPALTIWAPVFISWATAGAVVTTAPTTTDYVTRIIGYGNTADEMYFNPDFSYYTHT